MSQGGGEEEKFSVVTGPLTCPMAWWFEVTASTTIADFKKLIHERQGLSTEQMTLIYNIEELADHLTMKEIGAGNEARFHLILRPLSQPDSTQP